VAFSSVKLIDSHIGDSANEVDKNEDRAYGYVFMDGRLAAEACYADRDIWRL
jgi:hypothetical protein